MAADAAASVPDGWRRGSRRPPASTTSTRASARPARHKPNTAVAQAYYNKEAGIHRLATETGAGQWGSALAFACQLFGIEIKVYMVRVSYDQKPYRRIMMETWGAKVVASPSPDTNAGRKILAEDPKCSGSLGLAISEAVEDAVTSKTPTKYSLGSVLNHVLMHQTVIGLEAKKQMELAGDYPDVLIGCVGGGSNFAGFAFPFLQDKLTGKAPKLRVVAIEPTATAEPDAGRLRLRLRRHRDDGADREDVHARPRLHAGADPRRRAALPRDGEQHLRALPPQADRGARGASSSRPSRRALLFAHTEGIIPAPESAHAIRGAIDEAIRCREEGKGQVIVFNLSGHGHFDMTSYEKYLAGQLTDFELPQQEIDRAIAQLPKV